MSRQKDQKMRFDDQELSLMKNTFADNDDLLFMIRKVFLQAKLSKGEKDVLATVVKGPVYDMLEKFFLPKIDADAPLFQLVDMHLALNVDLKSLSADQAAPLIAAKEIEVDYIAQQCEVLKDINADVPQVIKLADLIDKKDDSYDKYIKILARNYLLSYIDSNLQQLKFLAGKKDESVEETLKRLQQNSNK